MFTHYNLKLVIGHHGLVVSQKLSVYTAVVKLHDIISLLIPELVMSLCVVFLSDEVSTLKSQ